MPARHFGYYDTWKTEILICPKCGWSGTFEQGSVEYHQELMDSSCPLCEGSDVPMLAIVSYPTMEEAHHDMLSDSQNDHGTRRKQFLAEFENRKLNSPADLHDLSTSPLALSWDCSEDDQGRRCTVIKHEGEILWSEPTVWDGAERFAEVLAILKQKYGPRLVDVVPSDASALYLYGDDFGARDVIERARANLRTEGPGGQSSNHQS